MPEHIRHKIRPTMQDEYHTCGFCAANSLYKYYGVDPEERLIRDYLGTDHLLPYRLPFREKIEELLGGMDSFWSGTSPMDLLAVLYWDGFDTSLRTGRYSSYRDELHTHLRNGDVAIAIMYSCYHWVVISGMDKKGVWVVDGMFTAKDMEPGSRSRSHTYHLSHEDYAEELHGTILVSRDHCAPEEIREMSNADFAREYARGFSFSCLIAGKSIPKLIRRYLPERWE